MIGTITRAFGALALVAALFGAPRAAAVAGPMLAPVPAQSGG